MIFVAITGVLSLLMWKKNKDILNPLFITYIVWFFFVFSYNLLTIIYKNLEPLSMKFYNITSIYLITFSIVYWFISKIKISQKEQNEERESKVEFSEKIMNFLLLFAIISNFIYIYILFTAAGTFNISVAISNIRNIASGSDAQYLKSAIRISSLLFNISPVILSYIVFFNVKASKKKTGLLVIQMVFISLILATKGRIIRFTILIIILLKQKLSKRVFRIMAMIIILISIIGLNFMVNIRDSSYFEKNYMIDYIYLYLWSPLPGLDRLVDEQLNYSSTAFGTRTFDFIYKIGNKVFGLEMPIASDPGYILVQSVSKQITTNVFTLIGPYYMDFGIYGGIICGIIYAVLFGYSYKQMKKYKKRDFTIFYILNFPFLLFQTFGDFIIPTFSITLQELIAVLIVERFFRRIKINSK